MIQYQKLYHQRLDGKYQIWWLERQGSEYRSVSGIYDHINHIPVETSVVTSEWKRASATNIGKSNMRNDEEQAEFIISSIYKNRFENGYVKNIGDKPVLEKINPMLAQKYEHKNIKFPCFSQPKLDGIRAIVTINGIFSRNWKPILSVPHIHEYLMPWLEQGYIFDGELYNHDLKHDFNKIISLTRKTKPTIEDIQESKQIIKYFVFDMLSDNTFLNRWNEIISLDMKDPVVYTKTTRIYTQDELDNVYSEYLQDGYEGQMIRYDSLYENRRSKSLLKRKEFIDEEFTIIDILPGEGNWNGSAKKILMLTKDGKNFTGTLKGDYDTGVIILNEKEKYIGGEATCRYQNLTPDNNLGTGKVPRFPVVTALFEEKRNL